MIEACLSNWSHAVEKQKVDHFAVFVSQSLGCCGRTFCHTLMASPTTLSTGFVKAAPVLCTGTSRKHTGDPSPCCQRTHPTRRRRISSRRRPNNHTSANARTISMGWNVCNVPFPLPGDFRAMSSAVRLSPAQYKLRPHVVRDYTWGRTDEGFDTRWRSEAAIRVEAWRDDTPLL
jgi:hypothetical protein